MRSTDAEDGTPVYITDWSPDADEWNANWLRTLCWDIHPHTAQALLKAIGAEDKDFEGQKQAIAGFLKRPAAVPMPLKVKEDLEKRGLWPEGTPFPLPKRPRG